MHRPSHPRPPATAPVLLALLGLFACTAPAGAFPTWIGVYGNEVRHTDSQNPGTFTILLNEDYFGLNASVGIQVNGGGWTEFPMSYAGHTNLDSRWRYTPPAPYPAGAVVRYYFHGWDGSGNIWDNNGGGDYAFTATAVSVFAPLVQGVTQVTSPGAPGPLFPTSDAWAPIVAADDDASFPSACVYARTNGLGRVVAFSADSMFSAVNTLDNGVLLDNVVRWLGAAPTGTVRYTTGHGEWIQNFTDLSQRLATNGYTFAALAGEVSNSALAGCSVLLVGNAWLAWSSNEVDAVRLFVEGGGGLGLLGLGWSWEPYHPGTTIEEYPMMVLAAPYGIRWLRSAVISDPTDQYSGAPLYHTFHPDIAAPSITGAMATLESIHDQHTNDLPGTLQSNGALRLAFTRAQQTLLIPAYELPSNHPGRTALYDFSTNLAARYASFYAKVAPYDTGTQAAAAWSRERFWRNACDALPLTAERKARLASLAQLSDDRLVLFDRHGVMLLDNNLVQSTEVAFVAGYLDAVPAHLHNLRAISVVDYLGARPPSISLDGLPGAVNVFGIPIADWWENSFPADIAPAHIATFCSVLAHEVNHVVDAYGIRNDAAREARRQQLIAAAGSSSSNYLRSMFADGFFAGAPQEFVASIANEWFTDSAHTLALGLQRFAQGGRHPINQTLFFADLYAEGDRTWFYRIDTNATLWRYPVALERDGSGRIVALHDGGTNHLFTLDATGDVVSIAVSPYTDTDADGIPDWWTQHYFGHATGRVDDLSRAGDDASGTGQPNLFKYVAGLDPTSFTNRFAWQIALTSSVPTVSFGPAVGGRTYAVERSTNLAAGGFDRVLVVTQRIDAAILNWKDPAGGMAPNYRLHVNVNGP